MSTMTVAVLIAGYLGLVGFVLALLTIAKRSDQATEHHARAVALAGEQLPPPEGVRGDAEFATDDAEFLTRLDRRATRDFERRRFARDRTSARSPAPRDR